MDVDPRTRALYPDSAMEEDLRLIKRVICDVLGDRLERIILFGSRARGEGTKHSDYDVLVILKDAPSVEEEMELFDEMTGRLAKHLIPADIVIVSKDEAEYLAGKVGNVVRSAFREGTTL